MKVFICKFFNEEIIERKMSQLVTRERYQGRGAGALRVLCSDAGVLSRLGAVKIESEFVSDFQGTIDSDYEADFTTAYGLSDLLHASAEARKELGFSGVNFLSFEYDILLYQRAAEVARLCQTAEGQGCRSLFIVLTQPWCERIPDINTGDIKTSRYGKGLRLPRVLGIGYRGAIAGVSILKGLLTAAAGYVKRKNRNSHPEVASQMASGNQKALFVVSGSLYARPALAICNEFVRNQLTPYVAPYEAEMAGVFQRSHDVEYSNKFYLISSIRVMLNFFSAVMLVYRLRRHVNSFYQGKSLDGFSAAYLCQRTLLDKLPELCYKAISAIILLEKLVNDVSPDLVCVMPDGAFLQQTAVAVARKLGIPTLACSASMETANARSYMGHLHADKIATMGQVTKDIYVNSGVAPGRIVVTGVAHFDRLFNRNKERDAAVLMENGIDPGKRIIVFGTENLFLTETLESLQGVISAVLKLDDIHLVVKVHPGEAPQPYQEAAARWDDPRIHVLKDVDLYSLLARCDLVIQKCSTIALEAMMIDKPVIAINLSGQPVPVPYAEEGAALGVYRYEDIEPAILAALSNGETRARLRAGSGKFVRAWAGEPDGKASLRIVDLMKSMIAEKKIIGTSGFRGGDFA